MKKELFYILFSLASVITYGQVSLSLKADKSDYNAREIVNLTIVLELDGEELDQQSPFQLPDLSKFTMIGTGSYSNAFIDPETNTSVTQSITRIALEPKQKGKIKIGSVLVTVNNKIYKTEPFNIFIRDFDKKSVISNITNDIFLNMEIDDREVYQDQATYAVLRVYSKNIDNLRKVKNIKLPDQNNISVYPVSFEKSEIDPSGIGSMPSQVLAVFMVFPSESGWVEVPPVSAFAGGYSLGNHISSNKVKLNVKKLPEGAPESFKNAVGNFKVEVFNTSKEKIETKKPLNIILKVSGEGNFTNIVLPSLEKSADYQFYPPRIVSHLTAGKEGVKGEILANYVVIPKKVGNFKIKTQEFSYFNPNQKEYVNLGYEELPIKAFTHEQVLEARSTVEKVNDYTNNLLETVNSPVLKTTSFKVKEKNKFNWEILLFNIGILSFIIVLGLAFRKWRKKKVFANKKSLGSVAETEKEIRNKLKTDISDYYSYLDKLNKNQSFEKFFEIVTELDYEVRKQYSNSSVEDFIAFLQQYEGEHLVKEYKELGQRIEVAKYSPLKTEEINNKLLEDIIDFYSKITK